MSAKPGGRQLTRKAFDIPTRPAGRGPAPATGQWQSVDIRCCVLILDGYTSGMKTAISIPDDLFEDAEKLARALKKSRSRLYGDAVREYVARHSGDQVTQALDQMLEAVTSNDSEFAADAARPILKRSDW